MKEVDRFNKFTETEPYPSEFIEAARIVSVVLKEATGNRAPGFDVIKPTRRLGLIRLLVIRAAIMIPAVIYMACDKGGNKDDDSVLNSSFGHNPVSERTLELDLMSSEERLIFSTPEPTPPPTPTPEPTLEPILTPESTPESTPQPTPTPTLANLAVCSPEDLKEKDELYVAPSIGVKKRTLPFLESDYSGGAAQNTKLSVECQRNVGEMVWYRVNDGRVSFWIPETYASTNSIPVTSQEAAPPPQQRPPEVTPGGGNKIILTFDDSGLMDEILDILAGYNTKAIFFPKGNWANSIPNTIQRAINEGHLVCNHTYSHADLTGLSYEGVRNEILGGAGVGSCNLLRPPYGAHNAFVDSIATELGYTIYMWSIDTRDWARRYPGGDQEILNIVLSQARPGAVVLMHMHVPNTVAVLSTMIEKLQAANYELSW